MVDAYQTLLTDANPSVRAQAALDWAAWEDAHISLDPHWQPAPADDAATRWPVLATLVTHYWKHAAFLPGDGLISGLTRLRDTPTVLIHGRYDVWGPIGAAWAVHRALNGSRFVQIDGEGHGGPAMMDAVAEATTNFMV